MLYLHQELGQILLCEAVSCLLYRENIIDIHDLFRTKLQRTAVKFTEFITKTSQL